MIIEMTEKKFDSEKEIHDQVEKFFVKMGYPTETGVPIPNTEKFDSALERLINLYDKLPLTEEQATDITKIIQELKHEATQSGFRVGFETGQGYAWYMEDNADYVRIDSKYVYVGGDDEN